MTEYDYSPEAYERYLATQNRIANWVDKTEQHRPQFENALNSVPTGSPSRPGPMPFDSHHKSSKRSPPSSLYHPQQYGQQPRGLFIPPHSPASESSDDYGDGPGPMPMTSPGMMMYPPQQPAYHPMAQPMMSPPLMVMPPSYVTAPHHKSSHHRHRSPHSHSHSHSRSHSQQTPAYYSMASPPVSPGYQYPFPQMMGGGHPGYIMMQPQQYGTRQMPLMSGLPEPPRSAPPNLTSFPVLPTPAAPASGGAGGYFQARPDAAAGPSSGFTSPSSPSSASLSPGTEEWSYGAGSPSHSVVSASTGTVGVATNTTRPHYFTSIPQYQGIHSAMASPPTTYMAPGPSQPNGPVVIPQNLHQRIYDLTTGGRHYLRRSVG